MRSSLLFVKKYVDKVVDSLQVVLFSIIFVAVMMQITWRYIFNSPITWSEELSRFIFIWISLLGWSQATRSGQNIRITLIEKRLPVALRIAWSILVKLATLAYLGLLVYLGAQMAARTMSRPSISVPWFTAGMVYLALPVGATFCIFYTLLDLLFPGRVQEPAVMD